MIKKILRTIAENVWLGPETPDRGLDLEFTSPEHIWNTRRNFGKGNEMKDIKTKKKKREKQRYTVPGGTKTPAPARDESDKIADGL